MFRFLKNHHQEVYKIMDSGVCRIYISECIDIEIVHVTYKIECSMSPHPVHMLHNLHHINITWRKYISYVHRSTSICKSLKTAVSRTETIRSVYDIDRPAQPSGLCGKRRQNLICIRDNAKIQCAEWKMNKYRISRSIRRTVIFSLEILQKNNDECILILVIYWKKIGLLHTKISNHNIIYSS